MHKSDEIASLASTVFQQLSMLGIISNISAIAIIDAKKESAELWMTDFDGNVIPKVGVLNSFRGNKIWEQVFLRWKQKESYSKVTLTGKKLNDFDKWTLRHTTIPLELAYQQSNKQRVKEQTFFNANFLHGYLAVVTPKPLSQQEENIILRFTKSFEQAFIRFLDLQKAEAKEFVPERWLCNHP
jgi:hypothetical protein